MKVLKSYNNGKWYWALVECARRDEQAAPRVRLDEARYFREVDQELRPWPVMFTLVPLAIGCAILVWVPILIPLWHWLRGW